MSPAVPVLKFLVGFFLVVNLIPIINNLVLVCTKFNDVELVINRFALIGILPPPREVQYLFRKVRAIHSIFMVMWILSAAVAFFAMFREKRRTLLGLGALTIVSGVARTLVVAVGDHVVKNLYYPLIAVGHGRIHYIYHQESEISSLALYFLTGILECVLFVALHIKKDGYTKPHQAN